MKRILVVDDTPGWLQFNTAALEKIFDKDDICVETAVSAKDGYDKVLFNVKTPYDLIITDLQMESDYAPMIAGEWFIRQVKTFPSYLNTKILIVSAMYNIEMTADLLGVDFLSKRMLIGGGELPLKLKLEEMGIIKE
ncbi:MAG: response regulator [Candidatus Gastranaerophilales bacterium]|nr:response regulator [Candidatus Gastranaerophilales bacterium]